MPITHQLNINSTFVSNPTLLLKSDTPIGLIGIAESSSVPINTITKISKDADLSLYGGAADNTITPELKILQEYGCNNIYVIRVAKGADAAATETNTIGTETVIKTGLGLFKDCFSLFRVAPELLLIPGLNSAAIVTKAMDVATSIDALVYLDFAIGTTVTVATTTRGTATGLGTKNARLIPCMPRVKRDATFESLATHTVGVSARTATLKGYGFTTSNEVLSPGINGIESGFNLSYTDPNADNQKLENLGIATVNLLPEGYVAWGNRNALFVSNTTETLDTYTVVNRIKQKLGKDLMYTANRFLDETSDFSTAKLLESALNNVIFTNISKGNIKSTSKAVLNENLTDYIKRVLVYDILISSNLPIEVITLNTQFVVQL